MFKDTKHHEAEGRSFVFNFSIIKNYNTIVGFCINYFKRWTVMLLEFIHSKVELIQGIYYMLHKYIRTFMKILNES